jgi:hypothetical protein
MRFSSLLLVIGTLSWVVSCGGGAENQYPNSPQCSDGVDNDGDGLVDFPEDPGCIGPNDDSEDSAPSPQCSDGRDNDGDGKVDYPNDPGCSDAHQDTETDDCPDGPNCPQCANGKDDDADGLTDYPNDPGCTSASSTSEIADSPYACSPNVMAQQLPVDGHKTGNLMLGGASYLSSASCGGSGTEDIYELRITSPKVVTATTVSNVTVADTVLSIRGSDCSDPASELACNDDADPTNHPGPSSIAVSLTTPGIYFLVVDAHDSGAGGAYDLQVNFLSGEGEECNPNVVTCGTGLVCRTPLGGSMNLCEKPVCSDGVDDDGDGKADYPEDPGCDSPADNDEADTCPGAGCPQCADGIDNDSDGMTDWPNDPNCVSASGTSESCVDTDTVVTIAAPTTSGTTVGAHNDTSQTCGSSTATAPEVTFRVHAPMALDSLHIVTTPSSSPFFDAVTAVYGPSCGGTALACQDTAPITLTDLAAGDTFIVVDGYSTGSGTFTLGVSGQIKNNQKCEDPLVTAGVLLCGPTATCTGTPGNKKCVPAACSDGIDNNGDGKIDYPLDPGCTSPSDNTEDTVCPGVNCPVCADGTDNDSDTHVDYAADMSCWAASGNSEAFCNGVETDRAVNIYTSIMTGTTTGLHSDIATESCQNNASGNDVAFALQLPVSVATLTLDTSGSSFDTVLSLRNSACAAEIACDDDGGDGTASLITHTNLAAGTYSVIVDGYSSGAGAYSLKTLGLVANGTACTSPLFASGVLACTSPATCTGGTCH